MENLSIKMNKSMFHTTKNINLHLPVYLERK
jgi:hypothetical protein